ncbi:MAG TPA: RcnB family protein, partial [Thermohalobaculum sp.]|nr:RcnB family protein [Thermohalobaculum sp.]
ATAYTVGAPLPPGTPFVALDWRQYRLPEPPRGLIYARVGRDVLLIDPASRAVERRLDPAEFGAGQG